MLRVYLRPARVPEKNFIPCIISGHTVCISCYYTTHRQSFAGLPDGASWQTTTLESRGIAFPLKPDQNATAIHQKYRRPLSIFTVPCRAVPCRETFCSPLNINEGQPRESEVSEEILYSICSGCDTQTVCVYAANQTDAVGVSACVIARLCARWVFDDSR